MVRSRGCSACCARRVYWNVNYFGVIRRVIAMARAVVGHRERAVPVACCRRQSMAVATSSR